MIPAKIPARFFIDIDKITLKFIWKCQETRIVKNNFEKNNNKIGEMHLPDFRRNFVATVTKNVWYWKRDIHIEKRTQKRMYTNIPT